MPLNMQPSPWLWQFLKQYERFRPTAYPATAEERRKGIWTLGWGHTKGVKEGDTCNTSQAEQWLHEDVAEAVREVNSLVHVPLTQGQADALYSVTFNCGPDPLTHTLGHKLNAGDYAGAVAEFKRWDRQAGKELPGLLKRRVAEAQHFTGSAAIA